MQASTIAPATIVRGRRDPHDIEIVLRFDPASPIARTEVEIESEERLDTDEYLAVVSDAAARLATYAGDFRAAMAADRSRHAEGGPRRPVEHGTWTLRPLQDGLLGLVDPTGQVIVTATPGPSQERLRSLFGRMRARADRPH